MKSVALFLIFAGVAYAQGPESMVSIGSNSEAEDDAVSEISCREEDGFYMTQCSCRLFPGDRWAYRPCDGSVMTTNRDGVTVCRAYNQAYGSGVSAEAMCVKLFVVARSADEEKTKPTAQCPSGYVMIGCNMHAHHSHQMRDETTGETSYRHEPDYATNTCAARCPEGAWEAGATFDGDITIVKNLQDDVNGCNVSAMCMWGDASTIPVNSVPPVEEA